MLFNSITFLLFFPTIFLVDLVLQRKAWMRKSFLLGASYLFYAGWDWRFLGLIWASTIVDWFVGKALQHQEREGRRRLLLTISLVGNLGMLCTFKYLDFFIESTNACLAAMHSSENQWSRKVSRKARWLPSPGKPHSSATRPLMAAKACGGFFPSDSASLMASAST